MRKTFIVTIRTAVQDDDLMDKVPTIIRNRFEGTAVTVESVVPAPDEPVLVNCIQVGHNYSPHPLSDVCMRPVPVPKVESASLSDCANWEGNKYGDCSGRLMTNSEGVLLCEHCFNVRHWYDMENNNPNKSMCGAQGGLIRMTLTNVNCKHCLSKMRE